MIPKMMEPVRLTKMGRSLSIREDQRMITREEISDVVVGSATYHIQRFIHISRQNMVEQPHLVLTLPNFKLEEVEVVPEKF
jgi:hypothetical protein